MRVQSIPPVAAVLLCVLAVGVSASTMESSVSTDPDEVIDIDWSKLPISAEQAQFLKEEIQGNDPQQAHSPSQTGSLEPTSRVEQARDFVPEERLEQQGGGRSPADETSPFDFLRPLLLWLVLVVAALLAYRYRDRLMRLLPGLGGQDVRAGGAKAPWPSEGPDNEIDQAWVDLVRLLDFERPWAATPSEVSAAAETADVEPAAVETLVDLFEEVHYGDAPATERKQRLAREAWVTISERGGEFA